VRFKQFFKRPPLFFSTFFAGPPLFHLFLSTRPPFYVGSKAICLKAFFLLHPSIRSYRNTFFSPVAAHISSMSSSSDSDDASDDWNAQALVDFEIDRDFLIMVKRKLFICVCVVFSF
jgi:hypothetical protein